MDPVWWFRAICEYSRLYCVPCAHMSADDYATYLAGGNLDNYTETALRS